MVARVLCSLSVLLILAIEWSCRPRVVVKLNGGREGEGGVRRRGRGLGTGAGGHGGDLSKERRAWRKPEHEAEETLLGGRRSGSIRRAEDCADAVRGIS